LIDKAKEAGEQIVTEKGIQSILQRKISELLASDYGSGTLIDDYKEIYKTQYIQNVTLFVGIFLLLKVTLSVYAQPGSGSSLGMGTSSMRSFTPALGRGNFSNFRRF
jgi:hypothetical protein